MRQFHELVRQLEQHPDGDGRVKALTRYFHSASDQDTIWAIALLSGKRPNRVVSINQLSSWAIEITGFPLWLFKESHRQVGDLAETVARLLPHPKSREDISLAEWLRLISCWGAAAFEEQQESIGLAWDQLDADERYLLNKLVSGGFRLRVKPVDLIQALEVVSGVPQYVLAIRLAEKWHPQTMTLKWLTEPETPEEARVKPMPFHPIQTLNSDLSSLGNPEDWWIEEQWEGIPVQLIRQDKRVYLWTTDHQLVTPLFPETEEACSELPKETVLEGILVVLQHDKPGPLDQIQSRMDCQHVTRRIIHDKPVCFIVKDCLVWKGKNIRNVPFSQRIQHVQSICSSIDSHFIRCSLLKEPGPDWTSIEDHLAAARERHGVGLELKQRNGNHGGESIADVWWKKRVDPLLMEMVVLYVEWGGRKSTGPGYELTLGLWDVDAFVPVTKTAIGLTAEDMDRIKAHVKEHTLERFGPVRQVVPNLVYTIIFEGVNVSLRHKSGITLKNPRIHECKEAMDVADLLPLSVLKKRFTQGI